MNEMNNQAKVKSPRFVLKDCALIAIATHKRANNLKEFRDQIENLSPDSLYHHFWANLLLPHFDEPEFINDFAGWVRHSLHDPKLAEQLAVLDPGSYDDVEELRYHLLELIDDRLDESEYLQWSHALQRFEFVRSQIVVFDTHLRVEEPHKMSELIPRMSGSSVFYHFIDARRRTDDKVDDFRHWLAYFGEAYRPLIDRLAGIDPYFSTLIEMRQELAAAFQNHFAEQTS
ncbi:DUF5752 family protein [Methylomicrobium lacus]|uniref:DUF5752 family protein n=1 Tax=Methylomicrobium lacus TaxID=136992 RepID=UPI00045EB719|nr:DUF5752 family protein [Methylomicrobium lacus]